MLQLAARKFSLEDFGDVFEPDEAQEPILGPPIRAALTEWLTEIWAEAELKEAGLAPRRRALFDGPPGVGKTTLAHHLAARLGIPMVAVRPDKIISKYVGQTGQQIGALFDLAGDRENPVIVFLDEFDAIARKRRPSEQGSDDERNATVDVLLQRIEQYDGFLIAATNFSGQIDSAVHRRFDIFLTLELPGAREREKIIGRYLTPFKMQPESLASFAAVMENASPALLRQFCEGLKRQIVIGPKIGSDMRREAVFSRLITTLRPHEDCPQPRLWQLGESDPAIGMIEWPLERRVS